MSSRPCISCGSIISALRIQANPAANRCIKCQTTFEKSHDIKKKFDDIEHENISSTRLIDTLKNCPNIIGKSYRTNKNKKEKQISTTQPILFCPHCNIKVVHLDRHVRKMHAEQTITPISSIYNSSTKHEISPEILMSNQLQELTKFPCGVCRKLFATNNQLELHRKEKHSYTIIIQNTFIKKSSKKQKIICSLCKKKFNNENILNMHRKTAHASSSKSTEILTKKNRPQNKHRSDPRTAVKAQTYHQISNPVEAKRESKFDGTRDYFDNYRENGRLGSHASHDAYGDEDFA